MGVCEMSRIIDVLLIVSVIVWLVMSPQLGLVHGLAVLGLLLFYVSYYLAKKTRRKFSPSGSHASTRANDGTHHRMKLSITAAWQSFVAGIVLFILLSVIADFMGIDFQKLDFSHWVPSQIILLVIVVAAVLGAFCYPLIYRGLKRREKKGQS
jgi:drug/metabolite transporter (DMT)-like permease